MNINPQEVKLISTPSAHLPLSKINQPTLEQGEAAKLSVRNAVLYFARELQLIDGAKDCCVVSVVIMNH